MSNPVIAITMGDAAGIGPELIVKVLSQRHAFEICRPLVIGSPWVIKDIAEKLDGGIQIRTVRDVSQARFELSFIDVLCPEDVHLMNVTYGKLNPELGKSAAICIQKAFDLAMEGEVQGVISTPINKEAFHSAGYEYKDELQYMADITDRQNVFMFGVANSVWTAMVTEHIAFREIPKFIKKERILHYIYQIQKVLKKVGISEPSVAVAALNVHAGEGGLFGNEEIDEIEPAIKEAEENGVKVEGPIPADIVFVRALENDFNGIVYMYHDQANIARKLQPKEKGCTLYMGLPVPCGTTAHGTAFDKAGKGISDPGSLALALEYTVRLSGRDSIGS